MPNQNLSLRSPKRCLFAFSRQQQQLRAISSDSFSPPCRLRPIGEPHAAACDRKRQDGERYLSHTRQAHPAPASYTNRAAKKKRELSPNCLASRQSVISRS